MLKPLFAIAVSAALLSAARHARRTPSRSASSRYKAQRRPRPYKKGWELG